MTKELIKNAFEDEVFFNLRQQRNNWAKTAMISMVVAGMAMVSLVVILPLDETRPYVVMVDRTTGEAEKIVQVRAASLKEQDAVMQAELVSYISDRETYDVADNRDRIPEVMARSKDNAAETLAAQWTSSSPNYPPTLYKNGTRVRVVVKSISVSPNKSAEGFSTARVRITKTREDNGRQSVERDYVVTIGYTFEPSDEATLQQVWKNPLGFSVSSYRIDAETVE